VVRAEPQLRKQLDEARAQAADLRAAAAQMAAALAETALARDEAVLAQQHAAHIAASTRRLADRLHAALTATYTEAARLNDALDIAQARPWSRMLRRFEGLRRRVATIARAAARGPGGR
jgi:hypothetical protein